MTELNTSLMLVSRHIDLVRMKSYLVLVMMLMLGSHSQATFDQLLELPLNLAGYMSIQRAGLACDDKINEAVEITVGEANIRCEEAVRRNLENIERKDEDTMYQVMEATRLQEESQCETKVEEAVRSAGLRREEECRARETLAGEVRRGERERREASHRQSLEMSQHGPGPVQAEAGEGAAGGCGEGQAGE